MSSTISPRFDAGVAKALSNDGKIDKKEAQALRKAAIVDLAHTSDAASSARLKDQFTQLRGKALDHKAQLYLGTISEEFSSRTDAYKAADAMGAYVKNHPELPFAKNLGLDQYKPLVETNMNRGVNVTLPVKDLGAANMAGFEEALVKGFAADPQLKRFLMDDHGTARFPFTVLTATATNGKFQKR